MARREQGRDAFFLGRPREVDARLLLAQANVAEDQMNLFAVQHVERFIEVVDRRDDLITGIAEHILIVERRQRLILDDEDPLDDLLTLPEQHSISNHDLAPATNQAPTGAEAAQRPPRCARHEPRDSAAGRSASPSCWRARESPRAAKSSA